MMDTFVQLEPWLFLALLILAVGLALGRLRLRGEDQVRKRSELQQRARQVALELSALARRQPQDPGEPYSASLAAGARVIRQGWERAKRVESRLRSDGVAIVARPAWQLVLVVPLFIETYQRIRERLELAWMERQIRQSEADLSAGRTRLKEVASLGVQERSALLRTQEEARKLQKELENHRFSGALVPEREQVADLLAQLELAALRLAADDPEPLDVVKAYPQRVEIEKQMQAVREKMRGHEASQLRLRPRLERLGERLAAFEQSLAVEEEKHPAPNLRERTAQARKAFGVLGEALARGEYDIVNGGLAEYPNQLRELEETLKQLIQRRARLRLAQEQTAAALTELRQWMRQFSGEFVMDTAQEHVKLLQNKLLEQARAINSEDTAVIDQACQLPLEEIRKARSAFEQGLDRYHRLGDRFTPEAIEGIQKRGEHLLNRLKLRHSNYHEKAKMPILEEHLSQLDKNWRLANTADPHRQSDLARLGPALQQLDQAWNELDRDTRRTLEVLEMAKSQQKQALTKLQDASFSEMAALAQQAETGWSESAQVLLDQRRPLTERAGRGNEDFANLLTEVETLQRQAAKLSKDYNFELARVQSEVARLVDALNGLADRLDRLGQHPYLDFEARLGALPDEIRCWLGGAQAPSLSGLSRWVELMDRGTRLRQQAEGLCRNLEGEVVAAGQDWAWTEDMLSTAEEYLGGVRQQQPPHTFNGDLTSARNLLDNARRKLTGLAAPRRKYLLAEYQTELADVRQLIVTARAHVDRVLAG